MSEVTTADVNTNNVYHRAKPWEIALFSLNNTASNLYLVAFSFLSYYATGIIGFATVTVATILGGARLFDGLIDPAIGVIIDRTNSKWGRFRPIMLLSNIGLALSYLFLFNTHRFSGPLLYVMYFLALIFHKIVYSFQQTVTKAAQPVLTNDPKQRPLFTVWDTIFTAIFLSGFAPMYVSNYLVPKNNNEFSLNFFYEMIVTYMILSFILTILAMIGIRRKDNEKYFGTGEAKGEKIRLREYWEIIRKNRPLGILALAAALQKMGTSLTGDSVILTILFGIVFGNYAMSGQVSVLLVIPNIIVVFALTKFAGQKGLKSAYVNSNRIALVAVIIFGILINTIPDLKASFANGMWSTVSGAALLLIYMIMRIFIGIPVSFSITMIGDISDYETVRSGRFVSGMIGTIFSFLDSISTSLVPIIIGFILAAVGFGDKYPDLKTPFSQEIMNAVNIFIVALPIAILVIVLIMMKFYKLDKATMEKVSADLAAMRSDDENE